MKKALAIILTLCTLLSLVGAAGAAYGEHEHQLMDMANAACHYSECTICFELFNVGDHTFQDGKCTVCGHSDLSNPAQHEHQLMDMANAACHYSDCTICFELFNVGDHTFQDGKCTVCGHSELKNPFTDVAETDWFHDEVVNAVGTGIINGKTPTEFKPNDFLTYGEAVKLAACMNQVYLTGKVTLKNGEPWYQTYAEYCKKNGITAKDYDYTKNATRAGYIEIFANALPDSAFKDINNIPDGSILDVDGKAPYAIYVYKLYRAGIVTGVDAAHNCKPDANIKRSEVATIISRMLNEDERVAFDMGATTPPATEDPIHTPEKVGPDAGDVTVLPGVDYNVPTDSPVVLPELQIVKQPEGLEAEEYGGKHELHVEVFGGKAPYTYEWYYNGYRNQKTKIENGDYAKDAASQALILSVEKENTLLGVGIFCKITDSEGTSVTSNTVKVYGPFSMPADSVEIRTAAREYLLAGRVADGSLKKGEKVSVIRNGKVIAIGTAADLQMFGKSLDETAKGDNVGIVFTLENGVMPQSGDTVVKYSELHILDTSDIVN